MTQYLEVADWLRARIQSGEFKAGDKLPNASEIQRQYGIRSINTVRTAQQLLGEEGLVETRRGVGAFVSKTASLKAVDVRATLRGLHGQLTTVLSALDAQSHRRITIDLDDPKLPDVDFILSAALHMFAEGQRDAARTEDPDHEWVRIEWAEAAELLRERVRVAAESVKPSGGSL